MSLVISDSYFHELAGDCEDRDLDAVWRWLRSDATTFEETREAFFAVLQRLVEEEKMKLGDVKLQALASGTIHEQLSRFRGAFPASDREMEDGVWFFSDACPFGPTWIHS